MTNSHTVSRYLLLALCGALFIFALPYRSHAAATSTLAGYDIIIVAGQSNAVGYGLGPFTDTPAMVKLDSKIFGLGRMGANNLKVIPATWSEGATHYDALEHWMFTPKPKKMGFAIPFARRYVDEQLASNRAVLIVPAGYGGTSVLQWLGELPSVTTTTAPDTAGNVSTSTTSGLYDDMVTRTKTALSLPVKGKNKVVAFLWLQGETDMAMATQGTNGMTATVYQQKLTTLLSKLRKDIKGSYPVIAGQFVPGWGISTTQRVPFNKAIADGFASDPKKKGGVISSSGLTANYPKYSNEPLNAVHFDSQSFVTMGIRYYKKWESITGK